VFLKTAEIAQFFGLLYSKVKATYQFRQKLGFAPYWAIFSQTHLVTLLTTRVSNHGKFGRNSESSPWSVPSNHLDKEKGAL
jgi:hypothetical protein